MAITYTNRKGKTYYLHQGVTKKGNPRYYFAMKSDAKLAEEIPPGYEIYENPNAQVFLRRIPPKIITDAEVEVVRRGIEKYSQAKYYQLDVKKNAILVYVADQNVDRLAELFKFAPGARGRNIEELVNENTSYSPVMRFVLVDEEERQFITGRYCFRGSVDDWISIGGSADLATLVKEYVRHLEQDSFYELY